MRLPSVVILAATIAFAALNVSATLARSTIPYAIHGEVTGIERRTEKHPGVDDVYLVTVGGRTLHVDQQVGGQLAQGERVDKDAWSRVLRTRRHSVALRPSADFRRLLAVMPLVVLAAVALTLAAVDRRPARR